MEAWGLNGKVAVVTGAARGIGEAVVRSMAEHGCTVAALDINTSLLNRLVKELHASNLAAAGYTVDVCDHAAVEQVVEGIENQLGPIDILVNVAGILRIGSAVSLTDEDWESSFAVNATGVFCMSRSVARRMIPRKRGSIITIGSNAASVPRLRMSAYAASKAAAVQYTKTLALELAEHHIRCNVVSPGSTQTDMQWSLWDGPDSEQAVISGSREAFRVGIPLQRLADPADIADAVIFLASDRSKHITMHNLYVDGGASLGG
ncbi:2,3-dihydro-2,3-dihydroxybenzoate dehydrogenase [Paenibacillus tarimensis]|uniref:2,3-dihydro-2,3-dihydroxybenzoate dehydrogenase n=1 Tax=Paenibacillus tarimensis TaxID=416012 RepID=UPI001F330454|nr:2,3-dihydro-2,3-dihydroxybenzoate dehydrogenase [Paenibacillus tarimensis]MCF2945525.1 2,3-dihydro-2,3-dihydroxybenzoate dehydrogenase [Paenibacillus tarimensis]